MSPSLHDPKRSNPRRAFIRHTVDVPLEVRTVAGAEAREASGVNVSHGGLAFISPHCPEVGQVLDLRIPTVTPVFEARARVAWCRPEAEQFLVGAEFLDATHAFQARMVQQVCAIERYRSEIREQEGRELTSQEAAAEWIGRFAGRFPDPE